jgi:hypothetical protein
MGNYLRRVATAAARTSPPGRSAVGMTPQPSEIPHSPVGRPALESLSDGEPISLELEKESTPNLILSENTIPEIALPWTESSSVATASAPQPNPEPDDPRILRGPAVEPEATVPRDPRGMTPLTEPSGATEQGHPAMDQAAKASSVRPDRPHPPVSPPNPVISPPRPVQAASESQPKDSNAIAHPGTSPGIAAKGIDSAATAEPVDRPEHHQRQSEARETSNPPQPSPSQPFRIQARQSNPSRVDVSILRKSARQDAGATKPASPSPAVPTKPAPPSAAVQPTVELSPSGGNQHKASIQQTEIDPLHPRSAPSDWQGTEKPGLSQLNTPSMPEAAVPRLGRGGQAIAPTSVADRLNSQKNGARIAIGRVEVQVNNHPQPVAARRTIAQPASGEINLESRFLGRFVLRPA